MTCNTNRIKELETKYDHVESLYHHLESLIKKPEVPIDHSINNQPLKTESLTELLTPSKIMKEYARILRTDTVGVYKVPSVILWVPIKTIFIK
jgi:hypothetical protein